MKRACDFPTRADTSTCTHHALFGTETGNMASFKFKDAAFTVDSPDVIYTEKEILATYTYETVVVEGTKVRGTGG